MIVYGVWAEVDDGWQILEKVFEDENDAQLYAKSLHPDDKPSVRNIFVTPPSRAARQRMWLEGMVLEDEL